MGLTPFNVEGFGGLQLSGDQEEVGLGGAIDLLNVDFDLPGRVRSRDGYSTYLTHANNITYADALPYGGDDSWVFVADSAKKVGAYQGGVLQGALSSAGTTAAYTSFVHIGTPGAESVYAYNGVFTETKKWNGTAWSTVSTVNGGIAALSLADNRVVVAGTGSSAPSRVQFSGAGTPETFGSNDYVDLEPGTSGPLTGLVNWQNFLFAFKRDRFYVFYGNSTDTTGNPVFNYRPVYCGVGPTSAAFVTVAPDGVYFLDAQCGIYKTTGGTPEHLGGLDLLFRGKFLQSSMTDRALTFYPSALSYANGRLYCTVRTSTGQLHFASFVYLLEARVWTYWEIPETFGIGRVLQVGPNSAIRPAGTYGPVFMFASGTVATTMQQFQTGNGDNGVAFSSFYKSGFSDFGAPGQEKTVRETELVGQGSISFGWARDMGARTTSSTAVMTLSATGTSNRVQHRLSQNGELLAWQASGAQAGGSWQLNRVTPMLRPVRVPGEKSA